MRRAARGATPEASSSARATFSFAAPPLSGSRRPRAEREARRISSRIAFDAASASRAARSCASPPCFASRDQTRTRLFTYAKPARFASNASRRSGPAPPPSFHMISYVFSVFRAALGLVTCVSASNASASSAASDSQSESRDEEASHEASDATEPERRRIPPSAPESPSLPPTSAGSSSFPRLSMSLIRSDIHLCGCGAGFVDASSRRARRGLEPDELGAADGGADGAKLQRAVGRAHQPGHLALGEVLAVREEQVQHPVLVIRLRGRVGRARGFGRRDGRRRRRRLEQLRAELLASLPVATVLLRQALLVDAREQQRRLSVRQARRQALARLTGRHAAAGAPPSARRSGGGAGGGVGPNLPGQENAPASRSSLTSTRETVAHETPQVETVRLRSAAIRQNDAAHQHDP